MVRRDFVGAIGNAALLKASRSRWKGMCAHGEIIAHRAILEAAWVLLGTRLAPLAAYIFFLGSSRQTAG